MTFPHRPSHVRPKPGARSVGGGLLGILMVAGVIAYTVFFKPASPPPSAPAAPVPSSPPASRAPSKPVASAAPTAPAAQADSATTLRIGSWNIEWLGKPEERSGFAQNVAQTPGDVAEYIDASDVSLLALQEIVAPPGPRPIRSPELDAAFDALKARTGARWDYLLFPGRNQGDQLTGVAWDTAVLAPLSSAGNPWDEARDAPYKVPVASGRSAQGSGLWNRPPHAMRFSAGAGKTDLVAIVVHMKSDYDGSFSAHRAEEASALARALPAVRTALSDQDLVVLGDTNVTADAEPAMTALTAANLTDLNADRVQTTWRGGTTDRIFVPVGQPEFSAATLEAFSDAFLSPRRLKPGDFKRRWSDHYMVITTITISRDDD